MDGLDGIEILKKQKQLRPVSKIVVSTIVTYSF
jgi:hypothetical protein